MKHVRQGGKFYTNRCAFILKRFKHLQQEDVNNLPLTSETLERDGGATGRNGLKLRLSRKHSNSWTLT